MSERCPVCNRSPGYGGPEDAHCNLWRQVETDNVMASSHDIVSCFKRGFSLQKRIDSLHKRNTELVAEVANLRRVVGRKHAESSPDQFPDNARIE